MRIRLLVFAAVMFVVTCPGCGEKSVTAPLPTQHPGGAVPRRELEFGVVAYGDKDLAIRTGLVTDEQLERISRRDDVVELEIKPVHTFTEAGIAKLRALGRVKKLSLEVSGPFLWDRALACLDGMPDLEELTMANNADLTDRALRHLDRLTRLRKLVLTGTGIRGPGLRCLSRMTELTYLSLNETVVDDRGLESMRGLTGLQTLGLRHTFVTDDGLSHLAGLSGLVGLDLEHTEVTGMGVARLPLGKIHSLNLTFTRLDDAGLRAIGPLSEIEMLAIRGTRVTETGWHEFVQRQQRKLYATPDPRALDKQNDQERLEASRKRQARLRSALHADQFALLADGFAARLPAFEAAVARAHEGKGPALGKILPVVQDASGGLEWESRAVMAGISILPEGAAARDCGEVTTLAVLKRSSSGNSKFSQIRLIDVATGTVIAGSGLSAGGGGDTQLIDVASGRVLAEGRDGDQADQYSQVMKWVKSLLPK